MSKVGVLAWAILAWVTVVGRAEPPRPEQLPAPAAEAPPAPAFEALTPAPPAYMDPRTHSWTQHRLPPADLVGAHDGCHLPGMCLGDRRCWCDRLMDVFRHTSP